MREIPKTLSIREREILLRWCILLESSGRGDFTVEKEILREGYVAEYGHLSRIDDEISELRNGEDLPALSSEVSQEVADETRAIFRMANSYESAYKRLKTEDPGIDLREPDEVFRGFDPDQPHAGYALFVTNVLNEWTNFAEVMRRSSGSGMEEAPYLEAYRRMVKVHRQARDEPGGGLDATGATEISELSKQL